MAPRERLQTRGRLSSCQGLECGEVGWEGRRLASLHGSIFKEPHSNQLLPLLSILESTFVLPEQAHGTPKADALRSAVPMASHVQACVHQGQARPSRQGAQVFTQVLRHLLRLAQRWYTPTCTAQGPDSTGVHGN